MIRLISDRKDFKENEVLDSFFTKLKMLIVMSKAFLNGYPLEENRLKEIASAAEKIIKDCVEWQGRVHNFREMAEAQKKFTFDHIFFQRVKLLATMAKSFSQGTPMGHYRKLALENNIRDLCDMLKYIPQKAKYQNTQVA
jgi:hypothetical protein